MLPLLCIPYAAFLVTSTFSPALRVPCSLTMSADAMSVATAMKSAAAKNTPFTDEELNAAVTSLKCLVPEHEAEIDWVALRALYAERAHLTHKDWATTADSAKTLESIIGTPDAPVFKELFTRVLEDGGWDAAAATASKRTSESEPWVVLVTGLNGIRKTTSVNSPWFKKLLHEALGDQFDGSDDALPAGSDSFFRQLDYMIATCALESFKELYAIDDIATYAEFKAAIFARYRTVAEILGVLLVHQCQQRRMNVMVETSGRDVGMYQYVDALFPSATCGYRKLVVNFGINDISFAERSVDVRMEREMEVGKGAMGASTDDGSSAAGKAIIRANAGGPYGSAVLAGVQADSVRVWNDIVAAREGEAGHGWFKAAIGIEARDGAPWRVQARGDGVSGATCFEFGSLPG